MTADDFLDEVEVPKATTSADAFLDEEPVAARTAADDFLDTDPAVVAEEAKRATMGALQAVDVMAAPGKLDWSDVNEGLDAQRLAEHEALREQWAGKVSTPERREAFARSQDILAQTSPNTGPGRFLREREESERGARERLAQQEPKSPFDRSGMTLSEGIRKFMGPALSASAGATLDAVGRSAVPAMGGAVGAASFLVPGGGLLRLGQSMLGAFGGAYTAGQGQEAVLQATETPEETQQRQSAAAQQAQDFPVQTIVGEGLAASPAFRPSMTEIGRMFAGNRGAQANVLMGAGISAATETTMAGIENRPLDPQRMLGAIAMGGLINTPTRLGRAMGFPTNTPEAIAATALEGAPTTDNAPGFPMRIGGGFRPPPRIGLLEPTIVSQAAPPETPALPPIQSPVRENKAQTSIVLPNGDVVVGGRFHGETFEYAESLGAASYDDLVRGVASFTTPEGRTWNLQGSDVPTGGKIINLSELQAQAAQPPAGRSDPATGLPEAIPARPDDAARIEALVKAGMTEEDAIAGLARLRAQEPLPPPPETEGSTPGVTQPTPAAAATHGAEPKALSQVIRDLSTGLDVPTRFGRLSGGAGGAFRGGGFFKPKANLIGLKRANDLVVMSHEAGHKLDDTFNLRNDAALKTELDFLGDNKRAGSRSSWTKSKTLDYKRGEGVAEFMRYYLTEPGQAQAMAPNTFAKFQQVLADNPAIGRIIDRARNDVETWINADYQMRIRSKISRENTEPATTLDDLARTIVDDLQYVKKATQDLQQSQRVRPVDNPYLLARTLKGAHGMARVWIEQGTVNPKTQQVNLAAPGSGLDSSLLGALKPVQARIDDFRDYLVARGAQELHRQGKESGILQGDADKTVARFAGDLKFEKAFNDIQRWNEALLDYAVESGAVTKEGAEAMRKMNEIYVPFHRVFETGANEPGIAGGTGRGLMSGKAASLKGRKGSERDIVDPVEALMKNAFQIMNQAEKARVHEALAKMAEGKDMGRWVERIATPKEMVKVPVADIRAELESMGADLSTVKDDALVDLWRSTRQAPRGENIISVRRGDKTEFYRLDPDLYKTVESLDAQDADKFITRMVAGPANLLRAGATLTPDFAFSNAIRDGVSSAVVSRFTKFPFEALARGLWNITRNKQVVADWMAAGGANSVEAHFFDRKAMQGYIRQKLEGMSAAEKAWFWIKSPLSALRLLSGRLEEATRVGEFMIVRKKLLKSGSSMADASRQAAFEARDLQDFAKGGSHTKTLRSITAFWNAALQGQARLVDALKNPATRWNTIFKGMAYVTLPQFAELAGNWDDEDYWDRPQWERDVFFMVPAGKREDGHTQFIRIPKPFTVGWLFGTLPQRMFTSWREKDPAAAKNALLDFAKNEGTALLPVPNSLSATYAVNAGPQGYDWFRRRPIVTESLKDLPADMQSTPQSSLTAKKIGQTLGVSPMKVDYLVQALGGGLSRQIVHQIVDRGISGATGEKTTAQIGVPGSRFAALGPAYSSQATEDYYARLTALRKEAKRASLGDQPRIDVSDLKDFERVYERVTKLRKAAYQTADPRQKEQRLTELAEMIRDFMQFVKARQRR